MPISKSDMNEVLNHILPEIKKYIDARSIKVGKAVKENILAEVEKKLSVRDILTEDENDSDISTMFEPRQKLNTGMKNTAPSKPMNNLTQIAKQKINQGKTLTFEEAKKTINPNNEDAIDVYEHIDYSAFLNEVDSHKKGGV